MVGSGMVNEARDGCKCQNAKDGDARCLRASTEIERNEFNFALMP